MLREVQTPFSETTLFAGYAYYSVTTIRLKCTHRFLCTHSPYPRQEMPREREKVRIRSQEKGHPGLTLLAKVFLIGSTCIQSIYLYDL
jgi:hypothetical protein